MNFEDMSPELLEKAKNCTTVDELRELALSEGYELTDDDLGDVAGGLPVLLGLADDSPLLAELTRLRLAGGQAGGLGGGIGGRLAGDLAGGVLDGQLGGFGGGSSSGQCGTHVGPVA